MKLLLAILPSDISEAALRGLQEKGLRGVDLPSKGGFLRRGNTTLLVGVREDEVEDAIGVLRSLAGVAPRQDQARIAVFFLPVAQFEQF